MKTTRALVLFISASIGSIISVSAQRGGLEGIIVETYYISDANDATDTRSGMKLEEGSVTYRIFADMAPGYHLQAVYGSPEHELKIETSTIFFNHIDRGNSAGADISLNRLSENTLALDSWVTIGAACSTCHGVLKEEDNDGSIAGGEKSDGGSEKISGGLLRNENSKAGIPMTRSDGMVQMKTERILTFNLELDELRYDKNASALITSNGAWSVPKGISGPTESNMVLIAQLTTTGVLSFEINLQIRHEESGSVERWVASDPAGNEFTHPDLKQSVPLPM